MEYVVGIIIGLSIGGSAALIGFHRETSFYPIVLMVISTYYVLFAVVGNFYDDLIFEALVAAGFFLAAVIGFKKSLWFVAVGLIAHGVFDYSHDTLVINSAVPHWWPGFCLAVDATLGIWLAAMLWKRSNR